jgi:hypothetical protein
MKLILTLISFLLLTALAEAQGLRGFFYLGPAPNNGLSTPTSFGILPTAPPPTYVANGLSNAYTAGVGLEERFNKYLGAGFDLGGIAPGSGKVASNSVATFSPNGYFHLPLSDWQGSKVDVYATAGYSLLFRDSAANGINAGGGLNYWFKERLGLMLEFRFIKVFGSDPPTPATQYYIVRFGLTLR